MIKKNIFEAPHRLQQGCHGGKGAVLFRRILEDEFQSKVSFLDYTTLPPNTSIGYHLHPDTEEVYIIVSGTGIMTVENEATRVTRGDVILNRKGGSHGLVNDGPDNLEILVFEGQF
jgi:mannose-6-phosphate isomerase-like protein (cupin superfamily)